MMLPQDIGKALQVKVGLLRHQPERKWGSFSLLAA
jgi:hypothetical protein